MLAPAATAEDVYDPADLPAPATPAGRAWPSHYAGQPWEVDEDIALDELNDRRRGDDPVMLNRLRGWTTERMVDEAEHLAEFGIRDIERLAQHVGVTPDTYQKRLERRVVHATTPGDRLAAEVLDRLIAAGRPFTIEALPQPDNDHYLRGLLQQARNAGRIRRGGLDAHSGTVLWIPAAAEQPAAA